MAHETGVAELTPDMSQAVQSAMSQMIANWDMDRAREGEALARILGDQVDTIADLFRRACVVARAQSQAGTRVHR